MSHRTQPARSLSMSELRRLRRFPSPAIANAVETFGVRRRDEGYMDPSIKCLFPEMGVLLGYACTARISSHDPPSKEEEEARYGYLDSILETRSPKVCVIEDLDNGLGAFWGEVNASLHKALGCVGTVTNGSVRDLAEVRELGYRFFASATVVSHAYVHIVSYATPVKVGGLTVNPGDLLHGDENGIVKIPLDIAKDVARAAMLYAEKESRLISYCKREGFDLEEYKRLFREFRAAGARPAH